MGNEKRSPKIASPHHERGDGRIPPLGWASFHIQKLQRGTTVQFRPRGNSMAGKIESGELCTVEPVRIEDVSVGEIVLCKVNGTEYLHIVKAVQGGRVLIGNNKGRINGWTRNVYGRLVRVEP